MSTNKKNIGPFFLLVDVMYLCLKFKGQLWTT